MFHITAASTANLTSAAPAAGYIRFRASVCAKPASTICGKTCATLDADASVVSATPEADKVVRSVGAELFDSTLTAVAERTRKDCVPKPYDSRESAAVEPRAEPAALAVTTPGRSQANEPTKRTSASNDRCHHLANELIILTTAVNHCAPKSDRIAGAVVFNGVSTQRSTLPAAVLPPSPSSSFEFDQRSWKERPSNSIVSTSA